MGEKHYSNREIDGKFDLVSQKMDGVANSQANFQKDIRESNTRLENNLSNGFQGVHDRQDVANGRTAKNETKLAVLRATIYTAVAIFSFLFASILIPIVAAYIQSARQSVGTISTPMAKVERVTMV